MNITEEGKDTKQTTIKKPEQRDSTKIVKYLKEHFGELCNYDYESKTIYLCDNDVLGTPAFIELLKKYKVFIQPSLF